MINEKKYGVIFFLILNEKKMINEKKRVFFPPNTQKIRDIEII